LIYKILNLGELLKELDKYNHKELHVHHTWRPNHAQYYGTNHTDEDKRAIDRQKAMRDFHVNTNGWSDIGQHVTLLPDGRFVTGRPFNQTPASIKGYNTGAFAVEMIGDFDKGQDRLEGWQRESIIGLAKYFDSKGKYIRFHRENAAKTCPGSGIDKDEFMAEVRGQKGDSKVSVVLKVGSKGADVKKLQQDLMALGYSLKPYGADGDFGTVTEKAVRQFQKDYKLTVDGKAGTKTLTKIADLLKAKNKPVAPAPVVDDKQVKELQDKVKKLEAELKEYKDYFKLQERLRNK